MCSRFTLGDEQETALTAAEKELLGARAARLGVRVLLSGEVRPGDTAPVFAPGSLDREPSLFPMEWGFAHPGRRMQVINARSETAPEKDMFSESTLYRRCLIPAAGYFEWKKEPDGKKTKYRFSREGERLLLGGLYFRSSARKLPAFVILTGDAPGEIASVHARMPLLIPASAAAVWLDRRTPYEEALRAVLNAGLLCKEA